MTWKRNVLVVANVTATSGELVDALKARAEREPVAFTLIVPATPFGGGRAAAVEKLQDAVEQLAAAGLEADGRVGDADPCIAVVDEWDPKRYDEIIVSTLPMRLSKWLHAGLPERIARLTDAPVTHLIAQPRKPAVETVPVAAEEKRGGMGPLSVLAWGGERHP
jgi:GABA permease